MSAKWWPFCLFVNESKAYESLHLTTSRVNISLKASNAFQISQNQIGLLLTLTLYDSCCLCASLSSRTQLTFLSIPDMLPLHLGTPHWSQSAVKCKKCRLQSMFYQKTNIFIKILVWDNCFLTTMNLNYYNAWYDCMNWKELVSF